MARIARSLIGGRSRSSGRLPRQALVHCTVTSIQGLLVSIATFIRRRTVSRFGVSRTNPAGGGSVLLSPSFSVFFRLFLLFRIVPNHSARKRSLQNFFESLRGGVPDDVAIQESGWTAPKHHKSAGHSTFFSNTRNLAESENASLRGGVPDDVAIQSDPSLRA